MCDTVYNISITCLPIVAAGDMIGEPTSKIVYSYVYKMPSLFYLYDSAHVHYTHMYTCTRTHTCTRMRTHTDTHVQTQTRTHARAHTQTQTHMYRHTHTDRQIHTYRQTHTYKDRQTHT